MMIREGTVAVKYGPEPSTNSASTTRTADSPMFRNRSWKTETRPRM